MMNKDQVIQALKDYRSYKYAISNGIAAYVEDDMAGMPMGGSYGSRAPSLSRGTFISSTTDYLKYKRFIAVLEGAINDVLSDNERMVIMRKYIDRNSTTLYQISLDKDKEEKTIGRWHKSALDKISKALQFVEVPEIINLDKVVFKMSI